jgi:toprim domain protein
MMEKKIIIVEGLSDKRHIQKIIHEDVEIICTHGTFGIEKFDDMLEKYQLDDRDVYIFVDADESGEMLRKQLRRELPHARHLYIPTEWTEVETTPEDVIATELLRQHFDIHPIYLI